MDKVTPIAPPANDDGKPTPRMQDISDEAWREYTFAAVGIGMMTYRITEPRGLVVGKTTHRVLDAKGVVHCVPTVGERGCVLRWEVKPGKNPIAF